MKDEIKNNFGSKKNWGIPYGLHLLFASKYLIERQFIGPYADCEELIRIQGSTQLTVKAKIQKGL